MFRFWIKTKYLLTAAFFMVAMVLFVLVSKPAAAAPNYEINYQGKLTDTSGLAVPDGTYNMRFWLITSDSAASTTAEWDEELTGNNRVQVTNGLFSVMLGSTSPLNTVDFSQTLYLGVEIGSTTAGAVWDGEMSPRKVLGSVPAAFEAKQFDGLATTSFLRSDAADVASQLLTFSNGLISQASSTITALTTITSTTTNFYVHDGGTVTLANLNNGGFLTTDANGVVSTTTVGASDLSLTTGYVFRGGSTGFAEATSSLFIADSGNVGIGTTTPAAALQVLNTSEQFRLGYDQDTYWSDIVVSDGGRSIAGFGTDADLNFSFSGATDGDFSINADDLFVDTSTGFVGVGTINPTTAFEVDLGATSFQVTGSKININAESGSQNAGEICFGNSANHCFGATGSGAGSAGFYWTDRNADSATSIGGRYNALNLATAGAKIFQWQAQSVEKAFIDVTGGAYFAGDTGIGDNSPSYRLEVASSTSNGYFGISSASTTDADILVVNLSGLVGIGSSTPSRKLTVNGDIFGAGLTATGSVTFRSLNNGGFLTTDANGLLSTTSVAASDLSLATGYVFRGSSSNVAEATSTLFIADSGRVGIGTTSPATILDVWGDVQVGQSGTPAFFVDVGRGDAGVGTNEPGLNLAGSTGDPAGTNFHLKNGSGLAQFTVEGDFPTINWVDLGGGADDKIIQARADGGELVWRSFTDSLGGDVNTDILSLDITSGLVTADDNFQVNDLAGFGVAPATNQVSIDSGGNRIGLRVDTGGYAGESVIFVNDNTTYGAQFSLDSSGGSGNKWTQVSRGNEDAYGIYAWSQSDYLQWIDETGRTGIGNADWRNTSPTSTLEISGQSAAGYLAVSSGIGTDGDIFLINGSGNVGVGTTTPNAMFEVSGATRLGTDTLTGDNQSDVILFSNAAGTAAQPGTYSNSLILYGGGSQTRALTLNQDYNGGAYVSSNYGNLNLRTTGNNADIVLTTNGSGKVGIGTSSPVSLLDIWGDFRVGTSSTPTLFADVSTGKVGIGTDTPDGQLVVSTPDTANATALVLARNNIESGGLTFRVNGGSGVGHSIGVGSTRAQWFYPTAAPFGVGDVGFGSDGSAPDIFFDSSAGKLGLGGTTTPIGLLSINGEIYLASTTPGQTANSLYNLGGTLYFNGSAVGSGAAGLWSESGSDIYFNTGNVGVGTSSPLAKFSIHAKANENLANLFEVASSTLTATNTLFKVDKQGLITQGIGTVDVTDANTFFNNVVIDNLNPTLRFRDGGADFIMDYDSGYLNISTENKADALTIDNDGNLGIGTTSPASLLDVWGDFRVGTSGVPTLFADVSLGRVGIGTSTPAKRLSVYEEVADAQFRISYDQTRYADFQIDSSGDMLITASGDDITFSDDNIWICESGSCPSITASSTAGYAIVENGVYFGNGMKIDQITGTTTQLGVYNASGSVIMIFDGL